MDSLLKHANEIEGEDSNEIDRAGCESCAIVDISKRPRGCGTCDYGPNGHYTLVNGVLGDSEEGLF